MALHLQYVEINVKYMLEEFSTFAQVRLMYKPEKETTLKVVFWRNPEKKVIQALIGFKTDPTSFKDELIVEGTDDPDSPSDYIAMVKFDNRLLDHLLIDDVDTVEELMENVPIFCLNQKVKKILWEEVNRTDTDVKELTKPLNPH